MAGFALYGAVPAGEGEAGGEVIEVTVHFGGGRHWQRQQQCHNSSGQDSGS
jgi:hypothetical protein